MQINNITHRENIARIREIIDESDAVLIGAGAGLSASAGLKMNDTNTFKKLFPGYTRRYGLKTISEAIPFYFPSVEEHYAFLARYISAFRYSDPPEDVYSNLLEMVKDKSHFVITTNTDGQFAKAGFEKQRIFSPHGDMAFFQCSMPCSKKLIQNRKLVDNMLDDLSENPFAIRSSNIPTCPRCGSFLELNIRESVNFYNRPWMQRSDEYIEFLKQALKGKLVLLELGVSCDTPTVIRHPFEYLAANYPNTVLIRINLNDFQTTVPFADRQTIAYRIDIKDFCVSVARCV